MLKPTLENQPVYIAGPMTGLPDLNFPAFFAAEYAIGAVGFVVHNPARNPKPDPETWENYMRLAIVKLMRCEICVLLPGWEQSKGAAMEFDIARKLGMAIYTLEKFMEAI